MNSPARPAEKQAHVVCIPCPVQSHIKAMLKMAKLLHSKGAFVTFVNTEFNHKRFLRSGGLQSLESLPGFRFETIPDGLPPSDADATQDIPVLCCCIIKNCMLPPFQNLLTKLNAEIHPVTSILSDGFMPFTADAAHSLGIPIVLLWTIAACAFMGFYQFKNALEKGVVPLKDESCLTNGYLDTIIDWIPGMRDIRLRDMPSQIRITDSNDFLFNFFLECTQRARNGTAIVLHTFDYLEQELVNVISSMFTSTVYTIGPQQMLLNQIPSDQKESLKSIGYSLWKEDNACLKWLDSKEAGSVVYVNFGSIAVMSAEQLMEFGWGLANSNYSFLWIIRPDLIVGESANSLGVGFMNAIKNRGFISTWCPQEDVLNHASVGGFLTHGGWNSIVESISAGVPMLCWPFFADQTINCKFMCDRWECGLEIPNNVKRDEVEKLVRLLMDGVEGKKMRNNAMEWKKLAEKACGTDGSSSLNLDKLFHLLKN
ncbi:7-deoxyloganetin glucosyltransferase-like [Apium graveolens]|uniref:7-deoxyloganetin glucosyltransferase-like n=1 Tax=Apium graveolens TaxID=4045 RepID=UPI003D7AFA1C